MNLYLSLLMTLGLLGCHGPETVPSDAGTSCPATDASVMPDQAAPLRCAAAKGLTGDILGDFCLDMNQLNTAALMSRGFNLMAPPLNCGGWEVANGKLQPKGIDTSVADANCGLALPAIAIDPKYSRVTLAIVHQANVPVAGQQATIAFPGATPKPLWVWINSSTTVDQRTIIEIPRTKISPPSGTPLQQTIQLYAPATTMAPTWTIDSIAVLGNP